RNLVEQILDAAGADRLQHRADIGFGMGDEGHGTGIGNGESESRGSGMENREIVRAGESAPDRRRQNLRRRKLVVAYVIRSSDSPPIPDSRPSMFFFLDRLRIGVGIEQFF